MIVYHGSSVIVESPDVQHSYRPLDFGTGFYVTSVKDQAARWARRKAALLNTSRAYVNCYSMSEDTSAFRVKTFGDNLTEWIDFICACRDGDTKYMAYDLITGKVANDKVFRVVDLYRSGVWDKQRALREIKAYPDYDQTAFITQEAIDGLLMFDSFTEVL